MKSTPRRRTRRLIPDVRRLESRRLLAASVTSLGQDGHDIVGPDASQGSDGIQDMHLQLTNLSGAVAEVDIQAPGGFAWRTEPDPTGAALAEYFPSAAAGQGDVYINSQIKKHDEQIAQLRKQAEDLRNKQRNAPAAGSAAKK